MCTEPSISPRPQNMVNFSLLAAEISSRVWVTPVNFNWFRVLASLLQRHRSLEVKQTLHDVCRLLCIHFRGLLTLTKFCQVQNSLYVQVLRSSILAALLHGTASAASAKLCGLVHRMEIRKLSRRRHLYLAGRPLRWASADILVINIF